MKKLLFPIAIALALPSLAQADNLLAGADMAYGEYLSSECAACHQAGGDSTHIPSIHGMDAETLASIMHGYRNKELSNPTMQTIAARLADDEIASLAVYFAALEP